MLAIAAAGVAQDKSAVVTPRDHRASPASGRAVKGRHSGAGLPALCETCRGESSIHIRLFCVHRPGHSRCVVIVLRQNLATKLGHLRASHDMALHSCLLIMSRLTSASSCRLRHLHEGKRNRLLLRRSQARIASPALRIFLRGI